MPESAPSNTACAKSPVIVWFRNDLRCSDNPALQNATLSGRPVLPIFIHEQRPGEWQTGGATQWWLYRSLAALQQQLKKRGLVLLFFNTSSNDVFRSLVDQLQPAEVVWNRRYEPTSIATDTKLKKQLSASGVTVKSFYGNVLHEPWSVTRADQQPHRVFTAWWNASQKRSAHEQIDSQQGQRKIHACNTSIKNAVSLDELGLAAKPAWGIPFADHWRPGEIGAIQQLSDALRANNAQASTAIAPGKTVALSRYLESRDHPAINGTSRLSPHLAFGEISPRQIARAVKTSSDWSNTGNREQLNGFIRQLGWRDFATHLLYYFPHTMDKPLDKRFENFPWQKSPKHLKAWQRGQTGVPLVDAGMRELWHTGWMHNRLRMVVGSFLVKNLGLHWMHGARWFWDTLLDADLANNTMGWQWVAGCGADAAPYFRVFNPLRQAERFDADADYVRHWVPEVAALPNKYVHAPWTAPELELVAANIKLGSSYPKPRVDLASSRVQALARFDIIKNNQR